jgi:hypothetical protein
MDSNTHSARLSAPPRPSRLPEPSELPESLDLPESPELLEGPALPESSELELSVLAGLPVPLPSLGRPEDLAGLAAVLDHLQAEDLDQLTDTALTQATLTLQRWRDCLDGQWLRCLAAVDARGAAGPTRTSRPSRLRGGCATGCG